MDQIIKKKVLTWINDKILDGNTSFDVTVCVVDIGLDPLNKKEYAYVEEVFNWHQSLINDIYEICYQENT